MDFDTTYTSPRAEAIRSLRGRIHYDPRFAAKPDALTLAEERQARALGLEAPPEPAESRRIRRWMVAVAVMFVLVMLSSVALLLVMGSNSR